MNRRDKLYVNKNTVMRTGLEQKEEPKVKREFIISEYKNGIYDMFSVTDMRYGSSISGGPILANFYDKELAQEYAKFKNNQLK